ncbi:MAG TPA: IclR family transcriptional regulator [Bradyrhizobium sp.]|nr:IclR family transcriptional regulator [Bradyrhizobium sp.]
MKTFGLLETLVQTNRPLSLPELTSLTGMPKATLHRVARLLEAEQMLEREPHSRLYRPGRRLLTFALDVIATSARSAPRHAVLEALSGELGETCNFGMMVENHVVYVDRVESAWPFGLHFEPGSRVPLHCTAMGKLLLAMQECDCREALLKTIALPAYTGRTITDVGKLARELENIRRSEISIDNQEFLAGVVCLAVPVRDEFGVVRGALAVSAPVARMSVADAQRRVPALRKAAARLSKTLSFEGGTGRKP